VKPLEYLGKRNGNIWKTKLMSLKLITRRKTIDLFRGTNVFKKGCYHRINIKTDENGNLLTDAQSVLNS
jgi:hypothetical protein